MMTDEDAIEVVEAALAEDPMRRIYVKEEGRTPGWIEGVEVDGDEIRIVVSFPA